MHCVGGQYEENVRHLQWRPECEPRGKNQNDRKYVSRSLCMQKSKSESGMNFGVAGVCTENADLSDGTAAKLTKSMNFVDGG